MPMVGNCTSDPLRSRKLRMLATAGLSSCIYRIAHQTKSLPPTGHHFLKNVADHQKHRSGSRWNPTREQLEELEEIYKRGTRTPPAHQIQLIAAELRRYGRIEGKNVFYWFQNQKARERQRLRCQLEADSPPEKSNREDLGGGSAAATPGILNQKSEQSSDLSSSAADAAPAIIEQKSPSYPWPPLHHHQQRSWTGEKATCQPPIGHQRPALANYDCAAAYAVTLGEKPMALELELFPLGGDSDAIDSSRDRRASVSSHVKFYQFL